MKWSARLSIVLLVAAGALAAAPDPPAAGAPTPAPAAEAASIPAGAAISIPAEVTVPSSFPGGPAPDLGLVFTAQVIGWIEPCG